MEIKLTKEAGKLLAVMYKEYLSRRKEGQGKGSAKYFDWMYLAGLTPISAWPEGDLSDALNELKRHGLATVYITGDCELSDDAIAILEDRFVDGLVAVTAYVSQLMQIIP